MTAAWRIVSALVTGLSTIAATSATAQTALDERQQHIATLVTGEIQELTGPGARNCGIHTLTAVDAPSPVDRKEVGAALRCVQAAQRRGEGAWAVWQVPGVDAIVFDGLGASAASAVHTVEGLSSDAEVRLTPCLQPRVRKDASIACANRPADADGGDIGKAITALKRDVERTSGLRWEAVAPPGAAERPPTPAGAASSVVETVRAAQRAVHASGHADWPRCPHHFDHPLVYREGWWFCERDAAFIAALGRVSQAIPRVKRR